MNLALLLVRLVFGLGIAAHGAQKLFGWFGGHGLAGAGGMMESLGFRPGRTFALAAGLGEGVGGVLTALGLLGPLGPALMIVVMLTAMLVVHRPNGFFSMNNGVELPLLYATGAFGFALVGPGLFSLDGAFGWLGLTNPVSGWIAVVLAVIVAVVNVATRHVPHAAQPHAA